MRAILDLSCPSGILWLCHSVIIQMKLEYLWGHRLIMGKWCLQASSFIFDRIFVNLAGNQDRRKISDGPSSNSGQIGSVTSELRALGGELKFNHNNWSPYITLLLKSRNVNSVKRFTKGFVFISSGQLKLWCGSILDMTVSISHSLCSVTYGPHFLTK